MSGEHPNSKAVAEISPAVPDHEQKSSPRKYPATTSLKWKFVLVGAVAIAGIACTATGIGAVVGIPLLAISGVAAVSLVSDPEKPRSKSSTHTLLAELKEKDPE
jgi:hypothetical protein